MATVDPVEELLLHWEELRERGQHVSPEELCRDRPDLLDEVRRRIRVLAAIHDLRPPNSDAVTITDPNAAMPRTLHPGMLPHIPGYEILAELGRGGMGVVFKARQLGLNRLVALKMILSGVHAGASDLARFHAEAETAAQLQHPNIVQVYEVGDSDGRPYIVMELVDGTGLDRAMAGRPLPPDEAARILKTLAEAVQYAHDRDIVHRDLKPANVLLAARGLADGIANPQAAKITDFGLAKRLDVQGGLTQTGAVIGTPAYMSPEQAEGKVHDVGPSTDIYALGAILYEMLTGRPPFQGANVLETLEHVRLTEPVPPSRLRLNLPQDLETICLKCLQKEPRHRYATARDLADDLGRFLQGDPIHARPVRLLEQVTRLLDRSENLSPAAELRPGVMLAVAPVPFTVHLLFFLVAGGQPFYPLTSVYVTVLIGLTVAVVVAVTHWGKFARLPGGLNRQLWSTRLGHVLALLLIPVVSYLSAPAGQWQPMAVYPFAALVAGVTFFNLGGSVWGRLYLVGLCLFGLSLLMALVPHLSAVMLGAGMSTIVVILGLHMRRVMRGGGGSSVSATPRTGSSPDSPGRTPMLPTSPSPPSR